MVFSTLLRAARVPLQPSNCCSTSGVPPQPRNGKGLRNAEGREFIIWRHEEAGVWLIVPIDQCFVAGREWRKSQLLLPQPNSKTTVIFFIEAHIPRITVRLKLPYSMQCAVAPPRLKKYGCHLNDGKQANCIELWDSRRNARGLA